MHTRLLPLASLPLLLAGCTIGHHITRFDSAKPVSKGDQAAYYALPRTVVISSFEVKKTEVKRGPVVDGKSCFDDLSKVAQFEVTSASGGGPKCGTKPDRYCLWQVIGLGEVPVAGFKYKVVGTPVLATAAEPDPDQIFRVDLGTSAFTKREIELIYGPLGVLESGTSFAQDKRVDIALAAVKTILGAVKTVAAPESVTTQGGQEEDLSDRCQEAAKQIHDARNSRKGLDQRILDPDQPLAAKEAAFLSEIYDKRIADLAIFLSEKETTAVIGCAARPDKGNPLPLEILHLDENRGVKAGSGADCKVPAEFASAGGAKLYRLSVVRTADDLSRELENAAVHLAHQDGEKQGFYYRIPAQARAVLEEFDGTTAKFATQADPIVAQLGIVAALPSQRTYQTKYTVTLDPQTGALKKLVTTSDAIDPALITSTGTAVTDVLAAEAEKKKAEAAAKDELALLERERKLLEEKKKIRDLRKDLGEDEQEP